MSSIPDWIIVQIKACKKNNSKKHVSFDLCDLSGNSLGTALSIPASNAKDAKEIKTIILSKLSIEQVTNILQDAGIEAYAI